MEQGTNINKDAGQADSQQTKKDWQLIGKVILIVIGIAILAYLGWSLYNFIYGKTEAPTAQTNTTSPAAETDEESEPVCESTLTAADKSEIVAWKTYTNGTRNYVFKYPQTWWVYRASEDHVILKENESEIELAFKSASEAVPVTTGFTVTSTDAKQIACEPATIKFYKNGDLRLMVATFTKDGIDFVVQEKYKYLGASIGGDIVEAWNLTLKTVEFD